MTLMITGQKINFDDYLFLFFNDLLLLCRFLFVIYSIFEYTRGGFFFPFRYVFLCTELKRLQCVIIVFFFLRKCVIIVILLKFINCYK